MSGEVGVVRENTLLKRAIESLQELEQRSHRVNLEASNTWSNQGLVYLRQLQEMIRLGGIIASSALARDECRGAHYKPAFELPTPQDAYPGDPAYENYRQRWKKQNQAWLKTTIAVDTPSGPEISFQEIDLSVLPPEEPRDYR
jgi:succinate dehydrogenase / fumarate reductase flavoprotein subunit